MTYGGRKLRCLVPAALAGAAAVLGSPSGPVTPVQPAEVVVIGTYHWDHLLNKDYTLTHLRALLNRVAADAVAIEVLPNWMDSRTILPGLPEVETALSWARDADVPAYGVVPRDNRWYQDRNVLSFRRYRESTTEEERRSRVMTASSRGLSRDARLAFEGGGTIEWVHGEESLRALRQQRQEYPPDFVRELDEYDDGLAERILGVAARHPGKRIAAIQGAFHYEPLHERLGGRSDITLLSVRDFLPIDSNDLESAWHRDDAILVLGACLDGVVWPQSRDLALARRHLDRLASQEPESAGTLYYRARWHMLFHEWDRAAELLEQVRGGAKGAGVPLPFIERTRPVPLPTFQTMATLALGNLYDLRGDHEAAVEYYEELLQLEPKLLSPVYRPLYYFDLEWYLRDLIAEPYGGDREEVARLAEAMRGVLWDEAPGWLRELIGEDEDQPGS